MNQATKFSNGRIDHLDHMYTQGDSNFVEEKNKSIVSMKTREHFGGMT